MLSSPCTLIDYALFHCNCWILLLQSTATAQILINLFAQSLFYYNGMETMFLFTTLWCYDLVLWSFIRRSIAPAPWLICTRIAGSKRLSLQILVNFDSKSLTMRQSWTFTLDLHNFCSYIALIWMKTECLISVTCLYERNLLLISRLKSVKTIYLFITLCLLFARCAIFP